MSIRDAAQSIGIELRTGCIPASASAALTSSSACAVSGAYSPSPLRKTADPGQNGGGSSSLSPGGAGPGEAACFEAWRAWRACRLWRRSLAMQVARFWARVRRRCGIMIVRSVYPLVLTGRVSGGVSLPVGTHRLGNSSTLPGMVR